MLRVGLWLALIGCSSLALGSDAPAVNSPAQKPLVWKLKAGQKLRVATQSEMTRVTKIKANIDETKIRTNINLIWEVKEVSSDGIATIEQRPERLAITLEHRLDPKYVLDSEILKQNPNLKGPDRDALRVLMEGTATIKLDSRGVVRESSVPPDWSEKLKDTALAPLHDQLVLAATPQLFPGVQLSLPAEPVEEGQQWLVESPKEDEKAGLSGSAKFVYRGEKPRDGTPLERIDFEFAIAGFDPKITVTSQSNGGVFWFDADQGRPVELQVTQSTKAEKNYRDVVMLLTTTGQSITTWALLP